MKLLRSTILFLIIVVLTNMTRGQENKYTVMTKTGNVSLIGRASSGTADIHLGDKLNSYDRLQVNPGGYIVLVDTNLQTVELSKEGIYNISSVDSLFTIKRNSIADNITKFIIDEMSTNSSKYKEMKTLGAVVRKGINQIDVSVPKYGLILDSLYSLSWYPLPQDSNYIIRVFNQNGNTLYMNEVKDTSITLNLSKFNLQYEQEYFWSVFDKATMKYKMDSVSFSLITPQHKETIFNQIKNLKKDFLVQNSPLNNFLIAKILSSENLNESALEYFRRSVKLLPSSEYYWAEYIQFLLDVGLSRKAMIEWDKSPFNKNNNEG